MVEPIADTAQLNALIVRWRSGDSQAMELLIQRARGRLELLARKMLRTFPSVKRWEDTDDVLQNSLMRLLRALRKKRPESARHFLALAALQIRRELLDLKRRYFGPKGFGAKHSANPGGDSNRAMPRVDHPASGPGPCESAEHLEFHNQVDTLPENLRQVIDLTIYHGYTQDEAAAQLLVTTRTVQNRYYAALVHLRRLLYKSGE